MTRAVIEKIVAGGSGLARTPDGVVLVRAVLPGEVVETGPHVRRRGALWSDNPIILEPSADRIQSVCPYFPSCGGCDFQHASRKAELEAKRTATADTFRRIAGYVIDVEWAEGVAELPSEGYRNSIRIQGGAGWLGYCEKHSHRIVDIEDCPIAMKPVRAGIREARAESARIPVKSATLRCGDDGSLVSILTSHGRTLLKGGPLTIGFQGRSYRVDPRSFFQVNVRAAELIARDLRAILPAGPRLVDLFAGVGTFALALADRYETVLGLEIAREAVADFRINASALPHVLMETWDASRGLKVPLDTADVVIVDPPRTGLPERLKAALDGSRGPLPCCLAYISCDPATLARDLAELAGAWSIVGPVRLYDMFSRTAHVESMAILEPKR